MTLGVVLLMSLLCLQGCAPKVNVAVPDPVKIDVNMNVDVTTRQEDGVAKKQVNELKAALDRRSRMSEVQGLKNDRIVGEDRDGYLEIVRPPKNPEYLKWAKSVVQAENNDRAVIYLSASQKKGEPLEMIQTDYAKLWQERAFPGEWIEKDDGTWVQK